MFQFLKHRDIDAFKAAISNLLNALDRNDISDDDRNKLAKTSVSLYASAQWWADNVMSVKFDAFDHNGEVHPPTHPIYVPLNRRMGFLLERIEWTRLFWPGTLLLKDRGLAGRRTKSLQWVNPNLWTPDVQREGLVGFYIVDGNTQRGGRRIKVPIRDTLYMHGVDFEDDFGGIAPAEVAYLIAGVEVEVAQTWLAIFRNRMLPFGIVQPAAGTQTLQEEVREKFAQELRRITGGSRNAGKTVVSSGRFEWIQLGHELNGVPVKDFNEIVATAVELATGVYTTLLSPGDSSYAEAEVGRRTWGHAKLLPHLTRLGMYFTETLAVEYTDVAEIKPRTDEIQMLKEDAASKANLVTSKVQATLLDLFTAQKEMEDEPDDLLKGYYLVQGIPVHINRFPELADKMLLGSGFGETDTPAQLETNPQIMPQNTPVIQRSQPPALPAPDGYVPDAQLTELKNWQIVAERKKRRRPFVPDALKETETAMFIEDALTGDYPVTDVFAVAKSALADKASMEESWEALEALKSKSSYRKSLRSAVRGLWSGATDLEMFKDTGTSAITREFSNAFNEGAEQLGMTSEVFTADDLSALQAEIFQEAIYWTQFGQQISEGSKASGTKLGTHLVRVESWIEAYDRIAAMGQVKAGRKARFKWVIDPAAENCRDCLRLNGRVYTGEVWDRNNVHPRGGRTRCGPGCKCTRVQTDEPVTKGRFPSLLGPKHDHDISVGAFKASDTEAYAYLHLGERDELMAVRTLLADAMAGEGDLSDPETYHVTLAYTEDIEDEALDAAIIDGFTPFNIRVSGLSLFNNPEHRALVLVVDHNDDLDSVQADTCQRIEAVHAPNSAYTEPDHWQPHITVAYLPDGVDMPQVEFEPFEMTVDEIRYSRGDYEVVREVRASEAEAVES
jgi:2'-5' RNA ligase